MEFSHSKYTLATTNDHEKIVYNHQEFENAMMKVKGKPIIFVTILGEYQIGKSTTLKFLTGDRSIVVGDGNNQETTGVLMYGPFLYNNFREKFNIEIIPNDETQIFFIDTEGSNGFNLFPDESGILYSKLVFPYTALSNVIISMLHRHPLFSEVQILCNVLKTTNLIVQKEHTKSCPKNIALIKHYILKPNINNFDAIQKKAMVNLTKKISFVKYDDVIPLFIYNINNDESSQSPEFYEVFNIFAQRLINQIEETRKDFTFTSESACEMYEKIVKYISKYLINSRF